MLNSSVSQSLWEVASSAFRWPETTKPWIVTTVLFNAGEDHAYLQTMCTDSGLEMASSLSVSDDMLVSVQCFVIKHGCWRMHNVTEVLVGTLGDAAVAVFRDDQGIAYCPDAPDLPAYQVCALVSAGRVVAQYPACRTPVSPASGRQLHRALAREFGQRQSDDPGASASAGERLVGPDEGSQTPST